MTSNSGPTKAEIARLRRERASAAGKIDRAEGAILLLRAKVREQSERYRAAGEKIVDLGGKIRT